MDRGCSVVMAPQTAPAAVRFREPRCRPAGRQPAAAVPRRVSTRGGCAASQAAIVVVLARDVADLVGAGQQHHLG